MKLGIPLLRSVAVVAVATLAFVPFVQSCAGDRNATSDATSAATQPAAADGTVSVRTIAGTGAPGFADGPAASATFLLPSGLALARDGTLFIADAAAQRIRTLGPDGTVRTVAGSGDVAQPGLSVTGGYQDGQARSARFDQPYGIAFAPNGDLYIADSRNACIRKLAGGTVSTVVGKAGDRKLVDGDAQSARLLDPRALGFDRRGNLYIADFGGGIRRFGTDGRLTTVHLKSTGESQIVGLAVYSDANSTVVVASSPSLFMEYHPDTGMDAVTNMRNYAEGNRPFGDPFQLAALGPREFVFSDVRSGTLRYLRLPAPPFVSTVFTRTVAGGTLERGLENVGYRDGSGTSARFYAPFGVAVRGRTVYVADGGNRRIREFTMPPTRLSEAGLGTGIPPDSKHYEIAYVGASWAFWDSLGDDSLCARLEHYLDASHRFNKPVRCHAIRIDAAGFPQMEDYIKNVLSLERFDAVVVNATPSAVYAIFPNNAAPSDSAAADALRTNVTSVLASLKPHGTALTIAWTFEPDDVSDTENLYERELNGARRNLPDGLVGFRTGFELFVAALRPLGIRQYDSFADFLAYERGSDPAPLFGTDDSHLAPRGNDFLARRLAAAMTGATP